MKISTKKGYDSCHTLFSPYGKLCIFHKVKKSKRYGYLFAGDRLKVVTCDTHIKLGIEAFF